MKFIIFLILFSLPSNASVNEVDKAQVFSKNILGNAGFENGKSLWTASAGTFTVVTSGSNKLVGNTSVTWDAAASADTLSSALVTIPNGLLGRSGAASCLILTPSGTATHSLQVTDGTNILSTVTVTSSTTPVRASVNFITPASGQIRLRLYANADEPSVSIDDCYMGPADGLNMQNVSQASFVGSAYFATTASCVFTRTSTSLGAFADTDCPGATVESNPGQGTIQTTDYNAPKVAVNNLSPGRYEVNFIGISTGNSQITAMAINDGTTTSGQSGSSSDAASSQFNVVGIFEYTDSGNRTFELYGSSAASAFNIYLADNNARLYFTIKRFPTSTEQAYRPDMLAMNATFYHDNTCTWSTTSATPVLPALDASCALISRNNSNMGEIVTSGAAQPGFVFTPKVTGTYEICAHVQGAGTTASTATWKLWDGTTTIALMNDTSGSAGFYVKTSVCGHYVATNLSAKTIDLQIAITAGTLTLNSGANSAPVIEWSIKNISQGVTQPLLVGGVVSSSSGVVKVVSAFITNAGTPTVTRQDGSWISSLTDNGTGDTTINFTAGTFSTIPNCFCHTYTTGAVTYVCEGRATTPISSSLFRMITFATTTGAAVDSDFFIQCIGAP